MYCPQCGGSNDDSTRFCTTCGFDMEENRRRWQEGTSTADKQEAPGPSGSPSRPQGAGYQPAPYQQPYGQGQQPPYQPPYQNPGYYQAPPNYGYGTAPRIPSYMGWAIATLILCFWPTGIVAVVYAAQVGNKLAVGDYAGAQYSSRKAKMWTWITFIIALAGVALAIIFSILAAAVSFNSVIY